MKRQQRYRPKGYLHAVTVEVMSVNENHSRACAMREENQDALPENIDVQVMGNRR